MKKALIIVLICLGAGTLFALKMMHKKARGFVVMELFTSQGCNNCPSADNLLGTYADKNDDHIIPIAFHVDYWNRLGWKDSLSDHQYAVRQAYYDAHYLHAGIYTPQLVLNGEREMIGSEYVNVNKAVPEVLKEVPAVSIEIKDITVENDAVQVQYTIDGPLTNATLNTVLIQHQTTTYVKAGENEGATLVNYNVARGLITEPAAADGTGSIQLPLSIDTKELSIVLFTQDTVTGKITGAMKEDL
jgi:hypothetical protein